MSINIIESEFNKKDSSAYQLSILLGMDSLVYFLFDVGTQQALLLKSVPLENPQNNVQGLCESLKQFFGQEDLFSYLFRRVRIALPSSVSAIVPARLFNEAERATYLEELISDGPHSYVQHDELGNMGINIVYPVATELVATLKKQFPTGKFFSPSTPLLLGFKKTIDIDERGTTVFAYLAEDKVYILAFEKQNLLFFNAYPFQATSDVMYFVLLVYDQLNLSPAEIPLVLSGNIVADSDIYRTLYRYVADIRFLEELPFLKFGRKFQEIPPYFNFNLYSLALCK
ncbi:MAG: DUF3822 family protein [Saprospiraceae bacterium]